MRIYLLSHKADLDGVASAVLAYTYLKGIYPQADIQPVLVDYDDVEETLLAVSVDADALWVCDLSLRNPALSQAFARIGAENVHIFDHHGSSRATLEAWNGLAQIHFDDSGNACTADLIFATLPDAVCTPWMRSLTNWTHSVDLAIRDEAHGERLSDVVSIIGAKRAFWQWVLESHTIYPQNFSPAMLLAEELAHEACAKSLALARLTLNTREMSGNLRLITALADNYETQVFFALQEGNLGWFGFVNYARRTLSFRCDKETVERTGIPVSKIAQRLGGGGHPCAAGAPLPIAVITGGAKALLEIMSESISDILWTERSISVKEKEQRIEDRRQDDRRMPTLTVEGDANVDIALKAFKDRIIEPPQDGGCSLIHKIAKGVR